MSIISRWSKRGWLVNFLFWFPQQLLQFHIWVLGQRLGKPDVEKFNKEVELIDYYMKKPEQVASQQQYNHPRFISR